MKEKILTIVSTVMLFIPWTILPLRTFQWALASPVAEIMITCYAVFMILSGAFTAFAYGGMRARSNLMKFCLVGNSLYAAFGFVAFGMMWLS